MTTTARPQVTTRARRRPDTPGRPAPLFVRVEEAAKAIGISRGLAYKLCQNFLAGRDGIPCRRFGARRILVPRAALDRLAEGS